MRRYFEDANDLQELRKQYKELLKKHHPDNGGNVSDMQEINAEYDRLFKMLKDRHENSTADNAGGHKSPDYSDNIYDWENDKALRETLEKIINFNGIEILICGQWIWVSGNTYSYRKELKESGFKWASTKKQWFWHGEKFIKKSRKTLSMDEIKGYYGSTPVQTMHRELLEA